MTAEGDAPAGTHPADWERLSALADGELPPAEAAAMRARVAREPTLAAALARIEGAKAELRALLAPRPRRRLAPVLGGALGGVVAASLAAALLLGGPFRQAAPPDALAWHRALAAGQGAAAASPLDLGSMGLRLARELVVEVDGRTLALHHYQGPNGCRLTHLVGIDPATLPREGLAAAWRAGGLSHALVGEGMDPARFAATAALARAQTAGGENGSLLAEARPWAPCLA